MTASLRMKAAAVTVLALGAFIPKGACALINGEPLRSYADSVRLIFTNGWVCTGAFIDPYTILTAAHCLVPERGEPVFHLQAVLSENDEILAVEERALIFHPAYSGQWWPVHDVGIVKTSENKAFAGNLILAKEGFSITGTAKIVGAGKANLESDVYARTMGTISYFRIGSSLFFLGHSKNSIADAGIDATVAPNDSGGPVFDEGSRHIVGVLTGTTVRTSAKYGISALSTATSILSQSNFDFVQMNLGN